jgi:hypothetical protein
MSIPALAFVLVVASAPPIPASLSASPTPAATTSQDPVPVVDNRPEIKALVDQLGAHANKRGKEDQEAISQIDKLVQEWKDCGPKDKALVVKQLDRCFTEKRQEDQDGVRDNKLYLAAATALGEMAPESVPVFLKWIGDKAHRKDIPLQRLMILKLGKCKSEQGREPLTDLLNDDSPQIQAAAAEALGEYAEFDQKVRKQTFEALLKILTGVKGEVDSAPTDTIARDRYDTIAAPIVTSLQRLSGHEEHHPDEWQRWWNKHKKDDWDETK